VLHIRVEPRRNKKDSLNQREQYDGGWNAEDLRLGVRDVPSGRCESTAYRRYDEQAQERGQEPHAGQLRYPQRQPASQPLPLWELETGRADNRVLLMGSVHFLRPSDYPLRAGLEAAAALQGKLPVDRWAQQTVASGNVLLSEARDPWRRGELQWQLGTALSSAVAAWQDSGDMQSALRYGSLAVEQLQGGLRGREDQPRYALALASLYYRMGSVQAIGFQDHAQALAWYEKALPLYTSEALTGDQPALARHGRELVSMGVSYWEQGQQDRAYHLVERGTAWLERAVDAGQLPKSALAIPYENLATIHQHRGQSQQSEHYSNLAAQRTADAGSAQPVSFRK